MEETKLPRREREKERQRQEMLEAALSLFSDKGYHNVTMHEIAGKAEFAIGTLYKFFKNKEDLYRELMLEKSGEFHAAVREAIDGQGDEVEKLRNYVKTIGEVFRAHVPAIRLYFSETHGASFNMMAGLDSELRKRHEEFLQNLTSVFAGGIQKNRFQRISDPYYLAISLDGIISAFLFRWIEAPDLHPYPEDPETILNILFKGLVDR
ncbi:MAG TPA: TetR/AcrR family transcriptional regulator [Deltaproteobacteria bacterium]|nr:TetR/AcrR family transcriptional regulator [Deltaproteobacteria bacterium]